MVVTCEGLDIASLADLPVDVLVEAKRVAYRLGDLQERHKKASKGHQVAERRKLLITARPSITCSATMLIGLMVVKMHAELQQLLEHSTLPDNELADIVASIQEETMFKITKTLLADRRH